MPAAPRKGELSMEIKEYQAAIEAVLFASGEPVAATRLAEVLELDLETAVRLADDWLQDVNTRGGGLLAVRLETNTSCAPTRRTRVTSAAPWISGATPRCPRPLWRCWPSWPITSR